MQNFKSRKLWLYVMSLFYIIAGVNHFAHKEMYLSIMPLWLPFGVALVYVSGVFEILFGILMLPSITRRFAAWGILLLLIAVFPANIQMSINYYRDSNPDFWLTVLRLPLQFVLIWWAHQYAKQKR